MRMNRLLLIDDDHDIHRLVHYHMSEVVDRIETAETGELGLRLAIENPPDVVLLDIDMPGMDGFEVCRQLRKHPETEACEIIFITVNAAPQILAKALDLGGSDFVHKPFHPIEMQARIRNAMRRRRLVELLGAHTRIDALTGLPTEAALRVELDDRIRKALENRRAFDLIVVQPEERDKLARDGGYGATREVVRAMGAVLSRREPSGGKVYVIGASTFVLFRDGTQPELLKKDLKETRQYLSASAVKVGLTRIPLAPRLLHLNARSISDLPTTDALLTGLRKLDTRGIPGKEVIQTGSIRALTSS